MNIHRENSRCMALPGSFQGISSPPNPSCSSSPPYQVRMTVTGYPTCFQREEELCGLYLDKSEVDACFRIAEAKAKMEERAKAEAEKFNKIEKKVNSLRQSVKNPSKAYWNIVEAHLSDKYKAQLGLATETINRQLSSSQVRGTFVPGGDSLVVVEMFEPNGEFSKRGTSLLQESYDFVYGKTIGNRTLLLERNPIVQAIQGTAAQEIRRIHSDSIRNIELIAADITSIIEREYPSMRAKRVIRRSRPLTPSGKESEKGMAPEVQPGDSGKVF